MSSTIARSFHETLPQLGRRSKRRAYIHQGGDRTLTALPACAGYKQNQRRTKESASNAQMFPHEPDG
jgi:hypothetical protein